MQHFLLLTITGLCTAGVFAIAASGLVLTYTTTGIFNFAHGAIGMVAAFAYWQLTIEWGWPAPVALAAVLFVLAPVLGALIERVLMRRVHGQPVEVSLVITLGSAREGSAPALISSVDEFIAVNYHDPIRNPAAIFFIGFFKTIVKVIIKSSCFIFIIHHPDLIISFRYPGCTVRAVVVENEYRIGEG